MKILLQISTNPADEPLELAKRVEKAVKASKTFAGKGVKILNVDLTEAI